MRAITLLKSSINSKKTAMVHVDDTISKPTPAPPPHPHPRLTVHIYFKIKFFDHSAENLYLIDYLIDYATIVLVSESPSDNETCTDRVHFTRASRALRSRADVHQH